MVIKVPVPKHTSHCEFRIPIGKAKCVNESATLCFPETHLFLTRYEPEQNAMVWKIKRFPGEMEYDFQAEVHMSSTLSERTAWSRPPIEMNFSVCIATLESVDFSVIICVCRSLCSLHLDFM